MMLTVRALAPEIVRRCAAGERVGLCTVVATKGSTPQKRGAAMLVLANGQTLGTLGGGCVEAEVRRRVMELLLDPAAVPRAFRFTLDQDYGWDDGLVCGGVMDIAVQPISPADAARSHWGVENGLHWCLDVAMGEDQCRIRCGHGAENFSRLRRIALNKLKRWQIKKADGKVMTAGIRIKQQACGWSRKFLLEALLA